MRSATMLAAVFVLLLVALKPVTAEECANPTLLAGDACTPLWVGTRASSLPCCNGKLSCTWFRETNTAACRLVETAPRKYAILVGGQSNAVGTTTIYQDCPLLPPDSAYPPARFGFQTTFGRLKYSTVTDKTLRPISFVPSSPTSSWTFANVMARLAFDDVGVYDQILVLNAAVSGSSIKKWQDKDDDHLTKALAYWNEEIKKNGLIPVAFLWHQGETDYDMTNKEYTEKLRGVIGTIRSKVTADLPVIVAPIWQAMADGRGSGAFTNGRTVLMDPQQLDLPFVTSTFGIRSSDDVTYSVPKDKLKFSAEKFDSCKQKGCYSSFDSSEFACENLWLSTPECPEDCQFEYRYCVEVPWHYKPSERPMEATCIHFNKLGQLELGKAFYYSLRSLGWPRLSCLDVVDDAAASHTEL